jgi:hypothetical protein
MPPVPPQGFAPQDVPVYPAAPPPPPEKKKTWLIVLIIVIVGLVLCCGVVTVGTVWFLSSVEDAVTDTGGSVMPDYDYDFDYDEDANVWPVPNTHEETLIDNDTLSIVVAVGSGEPNEYYDWYDVICLVENKTDEPIGIYFDYDTTVEGFYERAPLVTIYPREIGFDFLPDTPTEAIISIDDTLTADRATNLEGTLVVYSQETFETIGEFHFSMDEL